MSRLATQVPTGRSRQRARLAPVSAMIMVDVFNLRFLTGLGARFRRSLAWPATPPGAEPVREARRRHDATVFRTPTERLSASPAVVPVPEPAGPPETSPPPRSEAPVAPARAPQASEEQPGVVPEAPVPSGTVGRRELSFDEQAAFHAIAAMLGPGIATTRAPSVSGKSTSDGSDPGSPRFDGTALPEVSGDSGPLLDLLPVGILVMHGEEPIFVNSFLLDLLGARDLDEARAAGLDATARRLSAGPRGPVTIEIAVESGRIPMIASRHEIAWEADAATLACLRPCAETAWKRIAEELRDARTQAERANALKSDFLAKVSHEIRTPLNAILGFAEVILDERFGPIGTPRYKDYLEDIRASGTLVMSLVNDLLDLSKIEAGKMDLAFTPVDANCVVSECVSIMQPQALRESVRLRLSLWPGLPPVLADERSLRQIVLNLLSNAVKFNEPGGEVVIGTALAASGQAVLRVKDTGIGMSDAEIEIALEPFRQVAGTKPVVGTGLGLPLTKALAEANRARFSITSKKSEGTLVEIAFPPA